MFEELQALPYLIALFSIVSAIRARAKARVNQSEQLAGLDWGGRL